MKNRILITCPKGIAPILSEEIHALNLPVSAEMGAGVETVGSMFDCMKLNLHIRTGHRVLFCIKEFSASTPRIFIRVSNESVGKPSSLKPNMSAFLPPWRTRAYRTRNSPIRSARTPSWIV